MIVLGRPGCEGEARKPHDGGDMEEKRHFTALHDSGTPGHERAVYRTASAASVQNTAHGDQEPARMLGVGHAVKRGSRRQLTRDGLPKLPAGFGAIDHRRRTPLVCGA